MAETEVKLIIDAATADGLWAHARELGLSDASPRPKLLRSIYYDTPDQALHRAAIALRLRRDGRRWIQTAKAKGAIHAGLSRALECEAPARGGRLDLALIGDEALRAEIARLTEGAELAPVCETAIHRAAGVLSGPEGLRVEMAVDQGEIVAGERREPFREAELELLSGPLAGLFDFALALFPEGGFRFSRLSKAQRGYLLAAEGRIAPPPAPRNARTPPLTREDTAETAAQAVLRECLAQIAENAGTVRDSGATEGPHQLRVGLRRLRSAFSLFATALDGPETSHLGEEARWLAGEVGRLRDIDVAHDELIAREQAAHPGEPGFATLSALLEGEREQVRAEARAALEGARAQRFLLRLARYVECRGWLLPEDIGQTARLATPAPALTKAALRRAWIRTAKRARRLERMAPPARHELRKSLKRLRYAVEFCAPLLPAKKTAPFLKKLKAAQTLFGDLNDAAMIEALFAGPDAPGAGDAAAQRAIGLTLGASSARAEVKWLEAPGLWRALEKALPLTL